MARIIDNKNVNLIGDNLKMYRQQRKLSQKALSELLETQAVYICRGSIARIEGGSRTVTDIELVGLARALDVTVNELLGIDDIK